VSTKTFEDWYNSEGRHIPGAYGRVNLCRQVYKAARESLLKDMQASADARFVYAAERISENMAMAQPLSEAWCLELVQYVLDGASEQLIDIKGFFKPIAAQRFFDRFRNLKKEGATQ
jgi:hypothetical protein